MRTDFRRWSGPSGRLGGAVLVLACLGGGLGALLGACQARTSGMPCAEQSDCRLGLVCSFPKPDAGPGAQPRFGICVPGKRGFGEVCASSADCDADLLCSNEINQVTSDGLHGTCITRPTTDLAADLSGADLSGK